MNTTAPDLTPRPAWATATTSSVMGDTIGTEHHTVLVEAPMVEIRLQQAAFADPDEPLHHEGPNVVALFGCSDPTFDDPDELEELAAALTAAAVRLREVQS